MICKENICLRAPEPQDLELMYQLENDSTLWLQGCSNMPFSRYTLHRYIEQCPGDIYMQGEVRFTIQSEDEAAGFADLTRFDPRNLRAEVSIIVAPAFQHRGVATLALDAMATYARSVLQLHQLYALVAADNVASHALFLRAGYLPTAVLPAWMRTSDGGFQEVTLYTLPLQG